MASNKKKNNKGVALVLALGFASIMLTLSVGYVGSAISESNNCQRQVDSISALYEAERGMSYAFVEAQNGGYRWYTHEIDSLDGIDDNKVGDTTELIKLTAVPQVSLKKSDGVTPLAVIDPLTGDYVFSQGIIVVRSRVYQNSGNEDEAFVLSKTTTPMTERIIKTKLTRKSLFKYLAYFPGNKFFWATAINGKGKGGVYANGNLQLGRIDISNVTELSTNKQGAIYAHFGRYTSPYQLDDMGKGGSRDGKAPLPGLTGTHMHSSDDPYPWNWMWPSSYWPPLDWRSVFNHFYDPGKVNGVSLPGNKYTEDNNWAKWDWNKYTTGTDKGEKEVEFYDADGDKATPAYWDALKAAYGENYFDSDFWSDKIYKRTNNNGIVQVPYLDSQKQPDDWKAWLENGDGKALNGVVKDGNTGGYDISLIDIEANYAGLAKEKGLYIGKDKDGDLEVYRNGKQEKALPGDCMKDKEFMNAVRPKVNAKVIEKENVLEIDIGCLSENESSWLPENGIVYVEHRNVRLTNGKRLPDTGLTVASPYNVYIKGDYNYDPAKTDDENNENWRPSSVVSNSYVYVLSDNFNDPQDIPAYLYPRENPFELKWIDMKNFVQGNDEKALERRKKLQNEIKSFFGLSTIDIVNNPPTDDSALVNRIRSAYKAEYESKMPNEAKDTVVKAAIASPLDTTAVPWDEANRFTLERWWLQSPANHSLTIEGAFVQLGNSWIKDEKDFDGDGNTNEPLRSLPAVYWGERKDSEGKGAWGQNNDGKNPSTLRSEENQLYYRPSPIAAPPSKGLAFEYEDAFGPGSMPPGDLYGGTQGGWQEVSDFDHG